jgi:hypothetical protein
LTGHDTKSGFDGVDFGANPYGLGMAASMDWMHGIYEGLAKNIVDFTQAFLQKWDLLTKVNDAVKNVNRRTSHPAFKLKNLTNGFSDLGKIDSTLMPGVILQLRIVLGNEPPGHTFPVGKKGRKKKTNKKDDTPVGLTRKKLQGFQRMMYLFSKLAHMRTFVQNTRKDVEVRHILYCHEFDCHESVYNTNLCCHEFDIKSLQVFTETITVFLLLFRDLCQGVSKSRMNYPKFHMPVHLPMIIFEYANLFYTDTQM